MHQLIVLNHIGFRTDWNVQRNHLLHRTPVFCLESHTHDIAESAVRAQAFTKKSTAAALSQCINHDEPRRAEQLQAA